MLVNTIRENVIYINPSHISHICLKWLYNLSHYPLNRIRNNSLRSNLLSPMERGQTHTHKIIFRLLLTVIVFENSKQISQISLQTMTLFLFLKPSGPTLLFFVRFLRLWKDREITSLNFHQSQDVYMTDCSAAMRGVRHVVCGSQSGAQDETVLVLPNSRHLD